MGRCGGLFWGFALKFVAGALFGHLLVVSHFFGDNKKHNLEG